MGKKLKGRKGTETEDWEGKGRDREEGVRKGRQWRGSEGMKTKEL